MFKINKITSNPTVDFAAEDLKKYLRMMMPDAGEIIIKYAPEATDGFRLGLLEDFGLPNEAPDVMIDDVIHIDTTDNGGILAGSNPRSVLFAVIGGLIKLFPLIKCGKEYLNLLNLMGQYVYLVVSLSQAL